MNGRKRLLISIAICLVALLILAAILLNVLPSILANLPEKTWTPRQVDTIIVLGTPANKDGKPTPTLRERVKTGVKLLKEGLAVRVILTGAAAHNKFVEADVMAAQMLEAGVQPKCIVKESKALNTDQNAFDSYQIMKENRWNSAIIVSSPEHLLRANYIFSHYPIQYYVCACAEPDELSWWQRLQFDQREKFFLLSDILLNKGITLGLKPEQAKEIAAIAREADLVQRPK